MTKVETAKDDTSRAAQQEAEHQWKLAAIRNTWASRTGINHAPGNRPIPTVGEHETGFWGYRGDRD